MQNKKYKIPDTKSGFTLIELMVAVFIFSLMLVAIVSVFASAVTAYSKARAMKSLKENAEFAISSMAKDVRMGRILDTDSSCVGTGNAKKCFMIKRNRSQAKTCYYLSADNKQLGVREDIPDATTSCSGGTNKILVALPAEMSFDSSAGFRSLTTYPPGDSPTRRGWVEINLNINMTAGKEMEADSINVQTIVSSRDYGWE